LASDHWQIPVRPTIAPEASSTDVPLGIGVTRSGAGSGPGSSTTPRADVRLMKSPTTASGSGDGRPATEQTRPPTPLVDRIAPQARIHAQREIGVEALLAQRQMCAPFVPRMSPGAEPAGACTAAARHEGTN
jgi:hypothetical protein